MLLMMQKQIGQLAPGYFADVIAVPGNPLTDISATSIGRTDPTTTSRSG